MASVWAIGDRWRELSVLRRSACGKGQSPPPGNYVAV